MQSLIAEIESELPLTLERETDCRETWPKRWALLKAKVEKITIAQHSNGAGTAEICPHCGGHGIKVREGMNRQCEHCKRWW